MEPDEASELYRIAQSLQRIAEALSEGDGHDSYEFGKAGDRFKIYGNLLNIDEFKQKIENAKVARNHAAVVLGES